MPTHSPLPWMAVDNGNHSDMFDANGRTIVASDNKQEGTGEQRYGFCVPELSDAAFAAHCVNTHYALFGALMKLLPLVGGLTDSGPPGAEWQSQPLKDAIAVATQALVEVSVSLQADLL